MNSFSTPKGVERISTYGANLVLFDPNMSFQYPEGC